MLRNGRFSVFFGTITFSLVSGVAFACMDIFANFDIKCNVDDWGLSKYVIGQLIVDFCLLTSSIMILFYLLGKQQETLENNSSLFRRERAIIALILIIFDLSFILRAIFDSFLVTKAVDKFFLSVINIFSALIFDILPICLILFFHTQNFQTIKISVSIQENDDQNISFDFATHPSENII